MKKAVFNVYKYFAYNFKPLILFGILYSLFTMFAFDVIQKGCFHLAMKVCGITYLGNNTIIEFFSSPFSWLMIFVSCICITFLSLLSTCSIIYAYNASRLKEKLTLKDLIGSGFNTAKRVFSKRNLALIPYMLLLMPFVGIFEITSASFSINIPGFIMDAIVANKLYSALYLALLLFLIVIVVNWILILPLFTIEGSDFIESRNKSNQLMKDNKMHFIIYSLWIFLILMVALALIVALGFASYYLLSRIFNPELAEKIVIIMMVIIGCIYLFAYKYISIGSIATWFFKVSEEKGNELSNKIKKYTPSRLFLIVTSILFVVAAFLSINNNTSSILYAHSNNIKPSIAAHRGDSVRAPENSMPAFELAIEEGVSDWIELDVHQTKDGVIVVSHDDYLGRIGIEKYVHETTYEELMKYDSGKYFSKEYEGLRLCTLKEALELAKNKVAVQIEIKPTGFDDHIEEAVVDIIHSVDSIYPMVVLSMKDEPIKRIKEISPDITTIYCTIIASEGIENLEYADWYSIEESSINADLVSKIHTKGKKCFVWTINSKDNVQYLVDCNVDAILTDDPIMMYEALLECDYVDTVLSGFEESAIRVFNTLRQIID